MEPDTYGVPTVFTDFYAAYFSNISNISNFNTYLSWLPFYLPSVFQNASHLLFDIFWSINYTFKLYQVTCSLLFSFFVLLTISLIFWRHRVFYYNQFFGNQLKSIHHWQSFQSSSHPKYCSHCRQLICGFYIYRNTGWECIICAKTAHLNCLNQCERFPCKTPSQRMPLLHQFTKGNLLADSVCCICGIVCSSHFGLSGLRCLWCNRTLHEECKSNLPEVCDLGQFHGFVLPPFVVELKKKEVVMPPKVSPSKYMELMGVHLREGIQNVKKVMSDSFKERMRHVSAGMKHINAVLIRQFHKKSNNRGSRHLHDNILCNGSTVYNVKDDGESGEVSAGKDVAHPPTSAAPPHLEGVSSLTDIDSSLVKTAYEKLAPFTAEILMERFISYLERLELRNDRDCIIFIRPSIFRLLGERRSVLYRYSSASPSLRCLNTKRVLKGSHCLRCIRFRIQPSASRSPCVALLPLHMMRRRCQSFVATKQIIKRLDARRRLRVEVEQQHWEIQTNNLYGRGGGWTHKWSGGNGSTVRAAAVNGGRYTAIHSFNNVGDVLNATQQHIEDINGDTNDAQQTHIYDEEEDALKIFEVSKIQPVTAHVWRITERVEDILNADNCTPLLIFVNTKSGGQSGSLIFKEFVTLMNPIQVIDIQNEKGPARALEMFRPLAMSNRLRIVVCGGDGTVGWVINEMYKSYGLSSEWHVPIGILPLGTGNDLSKILGWGISFDGDIYKYLRKLQSALTSIIDVWYVEGRDARGDAVLSTTFQNYVEFGVVARIALKFHELRESHPELFQSRIGNKFLYGEVSVRSYFVNPNIYLKDVKLWCDGKEVEFPETPLEDICVINIPSFAGGVNLWKAKNDMHSRSIDTSNHLRPTQSWNENVSPTSWNDTIFCDKYYTHLTSATSQPSLRRRGYRQETVAHPRHNMHWDKKRIPSRSMNVSECSQTPLSEDAFESDNAVDECINKNTSNGSLLAPSFNSISSTSSADFSSSVEEVYAFNIKHTIDESKDVRNFSKVDSTHKKMQTAWKKQSVRDQLIEVVGFRSLLHMGQVQVGLAEPIHLCQGHELKFEIPESVPYQIDGEPKTLGPCTITISHRSPAYVLIPSDKSEHDATAVAQEVLDIAYKRKLISNFQRSALLREFCQRL